MRVSRVFEEKLKITVSRFLPRSVSLFPAQGKFSFSCGQTLIRSNILSTAAYQRKNLNNSRRDYRQGEPVVGSFFERAAAASGN